MQLSSRILTALAVLILSVAVVAVRGGGGGIETVEAATGTIDVLNVGTCYTTDTDVFSVGDCDDGDGNDSYDVPGDGISETGTVYATYAHDPKTAADDPRGILENSNLIKISIEDTGRDKRTPVLYMAAASAAPTGQNLFGNEDDDQTPEIDETETEANEIIEDDFPGIKLPGPDDGINFRWINRAGDESTDVTFGATPRVVNGITLLKGDPTCPDGDADDATFDPCPYKPMFTVDGDGSPISLYGLYDADGSTGTDEPKFMKLNKYLAIDEDVGSGRVEGEGGEGTPEVAPWFSVRVSLPSAATATLLYVVYETSEYEELIGGATKGDDGYAGSNASVNAPDFAKTETALSVSARSDGRDTSANLHLKETSRFSGRYEGYLKLTDENGDNGGSEANPRTNWGLDTGDASSSGKEGAAVLGVESGPVIINYRDTDGSTKSMPISIDIVPPTIQIDSPAHKSEGQDTSPEFSGSYSDDASGLREDSFNLYVDNTDDTQENGVAGIAVLAIGADVNAAGTGSDAKVVSRDDYRGYSETKPTFGVIGHVDVFARHTDANDPDNRVEHVEGDTFDDGATSGTFGDSVRIEFDFSNEEQEDFNNTIDFQALVVDVAGNIGFSDSDEAAPKFIDDLDKDKSKTGRDNVLGWYSRHIFFLDETDPEIYKDQSTTGFYGENDDDEPVTNRSGILIAFDRAVDPDSIDLDTFSVTLDAVGDSSTGASASVVDVDVIGRRVYLLLDKELASDATPSVDIPSSQWVSDPAGNRLTGGFQDAFEANDGIAPMLTVTLSGGSGTGEGNEGPSKLTNKAITATIGADEEIQSTPSLVVVCSNISWGDEDDPKELSDLVSARSSGASTEASASFDDPTSYKCGDESVNIQQAQSYSRPGLEWEYQWVDFGGDKALPDGKLTVVAYARDRKSFENLDGKTTAYNWGAATAEFRFDTKAPSLPKDDDRVPNDGDTVTESRPFILLNFDDASTVSVDEFKLDGTAQEIQSLGEDRFLYWPEEGLSIGSHDVSVVALDAAGNKSDSIDYSFKVAERKAFNVKLIAGWNAISFPANPEDPMIENVFTEGAVDMVAAWDNSEPTKPWSIASRMDGEWATHSDFATLTKVSAKFGYWVHAQGFTTQRVQLVGNIGRVDPGVVPPDLVAIPTIPGWNFVGVIDQDGDQTEDSFADELVSNGSKVNAATYLGKNAVKAYRWDAVRSEFQVLEPEDILEIGDGIWVYFGDGIAP